MSKPKKRKRRYMQSITGIPQKVESESPSVQVAVLKKKIAILKHLPSDFRDITPGTREWEAFADITGRRKEMEAWSSGPVLHTRTLNEKEQMFFDTAGVSHSKIKISFEYPDWPRLLTFAEEHGYSWIYLPEEELRFIKALNIILSRFGYCVRVRGLLLSERTGVPLGVVR